MSVMPSDSIENQEAILKIGFLLSEGGVRFFGLENKIGDFNYPLEVKTKYANSNYNPLAGEFSEKLRDLIKKEVPGLEVLQDIQPIVDVVGVDDLRQPILDNAAYIEPLRLKISERLDDINQVLLGSGQREELLGQIAAHPSGRAVLEAMQADAKMGFSFFSISDDSVGLDSVGGALTVQMRQMNRQLRDSGFLELQSLRGRFVSNVMVMQYGAVHTEIIDRAVENGIAVIDILPPGISSKKYDPKTGLHEIAIHSKHATEHFTAELEMINKFLLASD